MLSAGCARRSTHQQKTPPKRGLLFATQLREAALAPYVPDLVLTSVAPDDPHAGWPLFAGKAAMDGILAAELARDRPAIGLRGVARRDVAP